MTDTTETPASALAALQRMLSYGPALTQEERARVFELVCVLGSMLISDARLSDRIEAEIHRLRFGPW